MTSNTSTADYCDVSGVPDGDPAPGGGWPGPLTLQERHPAPAPPPPPSFILRRWEQARTPVVHHQPLIMHVILALAALAGAASVSS